MSADSRPNPRLERLKKRTMGEMDLEWEEQVSAIRGRDGSLPQIDPFLDALAGSRIFPYGRPDHDTVMTLCVQAPSELFHAAGIRPVKLACGSHVTPNLAPAHLPALTCPMIKSLTGLLQTNETAGREDLKLVVPFTCDWVVKFRDLAGLGDGACIHFMELPHLRENERSSQRWLEEVVELKHWLETIIGRKIKPGDLHSSIQVYARAFEVFIRLVNLRRTQVLSALDFAVIANAFSLMDPEEWIQCALGVEADIGRAGSVQPGVFLTGSPILFPNYKLLHLIDAAGMAVVADDVCSLERTLTGPTAFEDRSESALVRALADRHHKACICPTFADNHRRANDMLNTLEHWGIRGAIFHVLKGCHPFDMDAGLLETRLKEKGFRFIKIETDYVKEDEQNIVTRLEAFRRTLEF